MDIQLAKPEPSSSSVSVPKCIDKPHYANENWCMIGYHSVSLIADAMAKGTSDVDKKRALQACVNSATLAYFDGIDSYMKYKYVPENKSSSSVSKTLEYAYNDWCISQIAKAAMFMLIRL